MSTAGSPTPEMIEVFLQEASSHLQYLREYCGVLLDPYPLPEDLERLYVTAHTLVGSSAMYGFPLFSEVAGKLSHIFEYAMNATIGQDASGPLVEFISEGVAVLETDLLMISANGVEAQEEIEAFKQKYPFAFQAAGEAPASAPAEETQAAAEEEAASAAAAGRIPDLALDEEVPAEVLEFFVPECEEHLQAVTECLLALEANPNPDDIHRLFRAMHTVKGSAAQVGLHRISRVAHRAEDLVGRLRDGELKPSAEIVTLCLEAVDVLKRFLYRQWPDEATLQSSVKSLLVRISRMAPEEGEEGPVGTATEAAPGESEVGLEQAAISGEVAPEAEFVSELMPGAAPAEEAVALDVPAPVVSPAASERPAEPVAARVAAEAAEPVVKKESGAVPQSKSVRIGLERLDRMMNAVGELVINRTRMLGRLGELERLADVLNFSKARMSDKITEFQEKYEFSRLSLGSAPASGPARGSARGMMDQDGVFSSAFPFRGGYSSYSHSYDSSLGEFSELEMDKYDDFNILSRSLTEISADITEVLTQLDGFVRRVDSDIDEFTKLAHRLQDEITQSRMVPIGNLYTRISRTARDAANAAGKQVQLTLAGAETELDNNIIQQIADPLLHLVRNSIAHGIERVDDRYQAGKGEVGNVAVRAYHRGNHIYIEVEDDGRGIDYERVRQTAIDAGLTTAEQAGNLGEQELLEFLFHPGFSTAPKKTELAGRGVGLDVVRANLSALNGEIEIETQKGAGTRFTLKVPLTLIISQALFIRCGDTQFALPLAFVGEIRRLRLADIEEVGGKLLTKIREQVTEVVRLDRQLGLKDIEPINGWYSLVVVNVAGRDVGVIVEEVLRKDEIVIKNLGEYLRNVKLFPGATIAPDGRLIPLIDVNRLIVGESIEKRPLMVPANMARVFAPGAAAVAKSEIPAEAIVAVPEEKVIVLADDSISVRKFVGRMLEKAGYRVRLAADGLEALEIATQIKCNLVITDLEMPRTNGYELMSHLRQNPETRTIPVMVVTSRAGAKHRERALHGGASAFLTKPVQEEQLLPEVTRLIGLARPAQVVEEIRRAPVVGTAS